MALVDGVVVVVEVGDVDEVVVDGTVVVVVLVGTLVVVVLVVVAGLKATSWITQAVPFWTPLTTCVPAA
ncbi:MAG TPA: hypothetical protein VLD86_17905 [Ilumatobacteraceae bacterium]|nr:hypothetical protein [Ilumatobacteraceae bacterium]